MPERVLTGANVDHVAFPLGGLGAGMVCLSGTGCVTDASIRGVPEVGNEPLMCAGISVVGEPDQARIVEGPVPAWKPMFPRGTTFMGAGSGAAARTYGLPRFEHAEFRAMFPFATVKVTDSGCCIEAEIVGWSPFVPGDPDASSLPVAALEYTFRNPSERRVQAVFSFHAANLLSRAELPALLVPSAGGRFRVEPLDDGILFRFGSDEKEPWSERSFALRSSEQNTVRDLGWFRGGGISDTFQYLWRNIVTGEMPNNGPVEAGERPSSGGSIYVPFDLDPGEERTIPLQLSWYVPMTNLRQGKDPDPTDSECDCSECEPSTPPDQHHRSWYSAAFSSIGEIATSWADRFNDLRHRSLKFADALSDTDLPDEVVEAVGANLSILKSPTVLRQADGRLWAWEGCFDEAGCCPGSCTHVWNYAQAIPHLFPTLERTLRDTEFCEAQGKNGHQQYRVSLPIRPTGHDFHAASDGQLGGVMKVYRDWRISGDTAWVKEIWPRVQSSLDYCIDTWDPRHTGVLEEPHHNTYDIEFWGPDSMTSTCYLGALQAARKIGEFLGEETSLYKELFDKGRRFVESELWNGEYFVQKVRWKGLNTEFPPTYRSVFSSGAFSPENLELMEKEGPNYQYGPGCLSDGVIGAWFAAVCGVGEILDPAKVEGHLLSVYRYNFKSDLSRHANPNRSAYALGHEAGLLLCSWPNGGEPAQPFTYAHEVWTGIEYQVASHLALLGHTKEASTIVRAARARYDGRVRNPFDEIECGHWYARALASYALLQGFSGIRYDAIEKSLYISPSVSGDFRSFLSTATGYGFAGVRDSEPFIEVVDGEIDVEKVVYEQRV